MATGDFNRDGELDVFMTGMTSATVRHEQLGLQRTQSELERSMRTRMTYGNRLYLGERDGKFRQTVSNRHGLSFRLVLGMLCGRF